MSLITKNDLKTKVYPEIVEIITRQDNDIITELIGEAEEEVKSYLGRFNIAAMFVQENTNKLLRSLVKDVFCWKLIKLANPNINLELFRTDYEDAGKLLEKISKGVNTPDNWPLKTTTSEHGVDQGGNIFYKSNTKRNNHY